MNATLKGKMVAMLAEGIHAGQRQAEHIAKGYKHRGTKPKEAKRRAWATVNSMTGGGKKSGSGRGKPTNTAAARKGGRKGGRAKSR
jgi:hypothetical protein